MPVEYHKAVADVGLPIILFQLQPALAGVNFEPDTLRAMASVDGVVAIKEASFDARRFVDTVNLIADLPRPITLLTGNDNFILESFMLGATGALIGFGAVMTREQVQMIEAWQAGRIDEARALGVRVQRLADVVFAKPVGDYRVRLKECLRILGVLEAAHVRRPLHADLATPNARSWPTSSPRSACCRRPALRPRPAPPRSPVPDHRRRRRSRRSHGRRTRGRPDHRRRRVRRGRGASASPRPASRSSASSRATGSTAPTTRATSSTGSCKARKDWATSPNIRGLAQDYPIVEDDTPVSPLMYNAVGGSTIIFAGAWPRALPSDFRVRSLDGIADDWPIDYFELLPYFYRTDRDFGVSGLPGDPAYPPDTEDAPMPPLPIGVGRAEGRARPRRSWAGTGGRSSTRSTRSPYDGRRPCVQRSTCQSGCNEGAKASTDLTHWPKAIALGARLVTGARVRRIETERRGPGDRRDLDRPRRRRALRAGEGRRPRRERDRHAAAAAALGERPRIRTGWRTRPGSSASG